MVLLALMSLAAQATDVSHPIEQHLRTTGTWTFADGSSRYTFADDGGFTLAPTGLSGRSVSGTWTTSDWSRFAIDGQWSWVNGVSPVQDFRHMELYVSVQGAGADAPVYAVIESLVPQSVRAFAWAGLKTVPATASDPLSAAQAMEREAKGEAYYLACFDDEGRIRWLEKRLNRATMLRFAYRYDGQTAIRVEPGRAGAPSPE